MTRPFQNEGESRDDARDDSRPTPPGHGDHARDQHQRERDAEEDPGEPSGLPQRRDNEDDDKEEKQKAQAAVFPPKPGEASLERRDQRQWRHGAQLSMSPLDANATLLSEHERIFAP